MRIHTFFQRALERTWSDVATGALVGASAGLVAMDLDLPALISYWGQRAPLVVVAAVVFGVLWVPRLKPWLTATALALLAAWILIAFTPVTGALTRGLDRRDASDQEVHAVYVLASRLQADGDFTSAALSRLITGLEEARQSGTPLIVGEQPGMASYSEAARNLITQLDLDTELITIGPIDRSRDEAVAVSELFEQRGWSTVALVTSPSHSSRASRAFESMGVAVVARPARETRYDFELLRRPDERLQSSGGLLHERLGIHYYRLRGWIE